MKLLLILTAAFPLLSVVHAEPLPPEVQRLKVKYQNALSDETEALRDRYVASLEKMLEKRTKAGELDAAIAIREEIRNARSKSPEHSLKAVLSRTKWQWNGKESEGVVFQADGVIGSKAWQRSGLKTTWEVVDNRTVLLRIASGRKENLYAILKFNDSVTHYTGYNFLGRTLAVSRPIPQ